MWIGGYLQEQGKIPKTTKVGGKDFNIDFYLGCWKLSGKFKTEKERDEWTNKNEGKIPYCILNFASDQETSFRIELLPN